MISQTSDLIRLGLGGDIVIILVPGGPFLIIGSVLPVLPMRAATPAGHDQNSFPIGQVEKVVWLQLALQPNRIQVHVFDISKFVFQSFRSESQKDIGGPAAASNKHISAIDLKDPVILII